ncbi:hypothetical protein IG612_05040 [Pectobacterium sp. FL60-S17]|uniref:Uncharacterized protein n=1 Tax=Pectobacterium quasiaquaticum TaxID=2774015 RepID=A0A9Q2ERT8_9GAMM|nr:hypothetical protein [Pectobacterium quasiaquaticum]MBE5201991.1 hypothetical protein [Pectobacterium quasiaquaticum]MBE5208823.1 hypothetical protein [Pectobacterium quasiaquaticum]MBE5223057.1 hypothetical protein [Pectobacterium quasiaquaticum]URG50857.1 hypothetical protein IG609_010335 [Pectobacterium quasiaquaticum]
MNAEIKRLIHAFRNALVLAADIRSNECFHMARWKELNEFPHGCCDLASNFLAQYLQDSDPSLQPVIVHMLASEQFREDHNSTIHSHVIVRLDGWYIDLTLNQFAEYRNRVVIDSRTGTLGTLLRHIRNCDGTVTECGIELDVPGENGAALYAWLRAAADSLLVASGPSASGDQ